MTKPKKEYTVPVFWYWAGVVAVGMMILRGALRVLEIGLHVTMGYPL